MADCTGVMVVKPSFATVAKVEGSRGGWTRIHALGAACGALLGGPARSSLLPRRRCFFFLFLFFRFLTAEAVGGCAGASMAVSTLQIAQMEPDPQLAILTDENEDLQRRLKDALAAAKTKAATVTTLEVCFPYEEAAEAWVVPGKGQHFVAAFVSDGLLPCT